MPVELLKLIKFVVRAAIARRLYEYEEDDDLSPPSPNDSPNDEIEQGQLAISINEELKNQKDIWTNTRVPFPFVFDGSTSIRNFEIMSARLSDNVETGSNEKLYVIYNMCFGRHDGKNVNPPSYLERRYTDFLKLYTELKKFRPDLLNNIYFPKKVLLGNFSPDLIAERSGEFEHLLGHILSSTILKDSEAFLNFLQNETYVACRYLDERRNEVAVPILENNFQLLSKLFMDRSQAVLLSLCRLVAACTTSPVPHPSAEFYTELALIRYEGVSDTDLLPLYIPLLHTAKHLWWQISRDNSLIVQRLTDMSKKGINTSPNLTLTQSIHKIDPKSETI